MLHRGHAALRRRGLDAADGRGVAVSLRIRVADDDRRRARRREDHPGVLERPGRRASPAQPLGGAADVADRPSVPVSSGSGRGDRNAALATGLAAVLDSERASRGRPADLPGARGRRRLGFHGSGASHSAWRHGAARPGGRLVGGQLALEPGRASGRRRHRYRTDHGDRRGHDALEHQPASDRLLRRTQNRGLVRPRRTGGAARPRAVADHRALCFTRRPALRRARAAAGCAGQARRRSLQLGRARRLRLGFG